MSVSISKLLRIRKNLLFKSFSTQTKLVEVQQKDSGVIVVSMARPPVNGLNLELLIELTTTLNEVKKQKPKGIVMTSLLPSIFSGGLDIMEMYKPEPSRITQFWCALQDFWLTLYGLELPVAAAINGASPAGGCLVAISCEYRVMVDGKNTIGLNETQLGIIPPQWFQDAYIATIGYRRAELALMQGTLFTPKEALSISLVDELATDKADAIVKCEKYIHSYAKIPAGGKAVTKLGLRHNAITWLKNNRQKDVQIFVNFITAPKIQAGLELYLNSLKKK